MRWKILTALIAVVVAIPLVSIAADRFTDVPNSNTFHDDITWLADQGVTRGCNPPQNTRFCPDDPVTREQMAAFMRRFAGSLQASSKPLLVGTEGSSRLLSDDSWVTLDSVNVTVPAGGGALLLNGTAAFFLENDSDVGGLGILEVTVDQGCSDSSAGVPAIWNTWSVGADSATVVGSLPVSRGTHTIRLCALALHFDTLERTAALAPRVSALWAADGRIQTLGVSVSESPAKSDLLSRVHSTVSAQRGE